MMQNHTNDHLRIEFESGSQNCQQNSIQNIEISERRQTMNPYLASSQNLNNGII